MSARVDLGALSPWERETRRRWLEGAAHVHYGVCGGCGRHQDENGRPLLVARQNRRRVFHCLECWEYGPPDDASGFARSAP